MPQAIAAYYERTGQAVPESPDEVVRTYRLALRYHRPLVNLAELQARTFDVLYAIGGGTQGVFMLQFVQ